MYNHKLLVNNMLKKIILHIILVFFKTMTNNLIQAKKIYITIVITIQWLKCILCNTIKSKTMVVCIIQKCKTVVKI